MPSSHTRREVLTATLAAGALGTTATAQESGEGESTPTAAGGDWSSFQDGPRNAGYAPAARGPVDAGEVAWSNSLGPAGFSAPAVVGETVYVGTLEGSVAALSADDGTVRWTFVTDEDVLSSPAVADSNLYVGSMDGRVYALHTANGTERWSFGTGSPVRSSPAVAEVVDSGGAAGTPDTTGDASSAGEGPERTVFVGTEDGTLYALAAADGAVRWTYDVGSPARSPAVGPPGGDSGGGDRIVYVGDHDGGVAAVSAVDGAERWTVELGGEVEAPTVAGDLVYAAAGAEGLYALSASDGSERWRFAPGDTVRSPATDGEYLYVPVVDDGVYALSADDGSERWYARMDGDLTSPAVAGGGSSASSAGPAGTVYVARMAGDGIVRALSAADGDQRWTAELDRGRASAPAVVDDTLYLNAGAVVAIDEEGRTPTPTATPWDAEVVFESWLPTLGVLTAGVLGAPAVLGTIVYALGRFGRDDDPDGGTGGGDESGPDGGSAGADPD